MSLQETERKIYRRDGGVPVPPPRQGPATGKGAGNPGLPRALNPHTAEEAPFAASSFGASDLEKKKEAWMAGQEEKKKRRKKIIKKISIALAAAVVAAGIVWLALYVRKSAFSESQVKVSIAGPEKVTSGESVSFSVNYQNLNRASLQDAVLYVKYSENFKPAGNLQFESEGPSVSKVNIGEIGGKKDGQVAIQGKFFGARDALVYIEARLEYKSSSFNSTFAATANTNVFISSSPLLVEVSGPQSAASGNAVSYLVSYQNTGEEAFHDLKIKADFPSGFSFSNSEPLPTEGSNIWYISALGAGEGGQVKINGTINGARDEEKTLKVSIGETGADGDFVSFGDTQSTLKVIGSPIVLTETINKQQENVFVNAGETLSFKIAYKNMGTIGLRDMVLSVEANSPILDYARIDMRDGKGEFDAAKKTIIWRASEIPAFKTLSPGAEGEISFAIPVKEKIPVQSPGDKNFSFLAVARMDSPDVPTPEGANKAIAGNSVAVKLNSKLLAGLQGFFNDADISNAGSLPLKVGQETTFTMHLKITNVSNDITDAKATMALAPGVRWKNNFLPRDASVNFNDRTNELVLNLGSLAAGTGILTNPKELIFQIGATPSPGQAGSFMPLLSETIFSAKDAFTGQPLEVKAGAKSTSLNEDLGVGEAGKVTP